MSAYNTRDASVRGVPVADDSCSLCPRRGKLSGANKERILPVRKNAANESIMGKVVVRLERVSVVRGSGVHPVQVHKIISW